MSSLAANRARVADLDVQILLLERSDKAPSELRSEKQLTPMSSLAANCARVADLNAQILLLERSDEAPSELRSEKQLVQQ
ncbi:hypothetical protein B0H14DRAFT_3518925 [Mycena olivaceomarginata]|nr:hypothetical protein B0H14DRAFT_3518925 [Mycena olivaceomarginata]